MSVTFQQSPTGGYFITVNGKQIEPEQARMQIKPNTFVHKVNTLAVQELNDDPIMFLGEYMIVNEIFYLNYNMSSKSNVMSLDIIDIFFDPLSLTEVDFRLIVLFLYLFGNGIPTDLSYNFVNDRNTALPSVNYTDSVLKQFNKDDVYNIFTKYVSIDRWKIKTSFEYNTSNPIVIEKLNFLMQLTSRSDSAYTYYDPNGTIPVQAGIMAAPPETPTYSAEVSPTGGYFVNSYLKSQNKKEVIGTERLRINLGTAFSMPLSDTYVPLEALFEFMSSTNLNKGVVYGFIYTEASVNTVEKGKEEIIIKNIYVSYDSPEYVVDYVVLFLYLFGLYKAKMLNPEFVNNFTNEVDNIKKSPENIIPNVLTMYRKYVTVDKWKLKTAFEYNSSNATAVNLVNLFKAQSTPSESAFTYFDANGAEPKKVETTATTTTTTEDFPTIEEKKSDVKKNKMSKNIIIVIILIIVMFVILNLGIIKMK